MPTLTITLDDETYDKMMPFCGGKYTPEKVVVIMVKGYIRQDKKMREMRDKEGGN